METKVAPCDATNERSAHSYPLSAPDWTVQQAKNERKKTRKENV